MSTMYTCLHIDACGFPHAAGQPIVPTITGKGEANNYAGTHTIIDSSVVKMCAGE